MANSISFDIVCQLQEMLSNMSESPLVDVINFIDKNHFFSNPDSITDLLDSLSLFFNSKRLKSEDLTLVLFQFKDEFKKYFEKRPILNIFPFEKYKFFILHFSDLDLVTLEPNKIIEVHKYFSPEMKFTFHKKVTDDFKTESEFISFRHSGVNQRKICDIIRKDDLSSFQDFLSTTSTELSEVIPPSLFESQPILCGKKIGFIEYSAFYGSVNIFKFLILNRVKLPPNLSEFAVAGGNQEIIHICEENNLSFDACLPIAIEYKQDEIVDYLLNNYELTSDVYECAFNSFNCSIIHQIIFDLFDSEEGSEKEEQIKKIIRYTITSGHTSVLLFEIENGLIEYIEKELFLMVEFHRYSMFELAFDYFENIDSINDVNHDYGMRLVDFTIKNDLRCFSFLCGIEGIDLNGLDKKMGIEPPIIRIAKLNKTNLFETFLSSISLSCEEDEEADDYFCINEQNNEGETALHIACAKKNVNIVKMLGSFNSIDVDRQNNEGRTPLHYAAMNGSIEIVVFLVSKCQACRCIHDNRGIF